MTYNFLIAILAGGIAAGTSILLAALGEIITERVGVLNLGLEGIMLIGAVSAFTFTIISGNNWVGILMAMVISAVIGLIFAVLTVSLHGNQIVCGLALVIFGTGVSSLIGKPYIGIPVPEAFTATPVPLLSKIPFLGPVLFNQDALTYIALILVFVVWYFLFHTKPGLHLRSVGESPGTADALGINVTLTRYIYVIIGSALVGLGGAHLSLALTSVWIENMVSGRGWIAVAIVVFSSWSPWKALIGAVLFGMVQALGFRLQVLGIDFPPDFINMLPYFLPIVVVCIEAARSHRNKAAGPEALGVPYLREQR